MNNNRTHPHPHPAVVVVAIVIILMTTGYFVKLSYSHTATQPRVEQTTSTVPAPACVEVPFQENAGWDFTAVSTEASTGIWSTDGDDGPILGYALQEDSIVYETEAMARTCSAYHN